MDEKSYYTQGDDIVFARSLGIARNAIVLPRDYNLVSSNVAAQVFALGRPAEDSRSSTATATPPT